MKSKLSYIMLALTTAGLTACGGSNNSEPEPEVISYTVNASLPANATGLICADANQNLACDNGEIQTAVANASVALTSQNVALLNSQIVWQQDDKAQMVAPAAIADNANIVLSPATSLVVGQMLLGETKENAIAKVTSSLNDSLSLQLDSSTLLTAEQTELADFTEKYQSLWLSALDQSTNPATLLSGFSLQLDNIAKAISNNQHMSQMGYFIDNSMLWSGAYPMTDTGLLTFATNDSFDSTSTIAEFPGQDADYGLDVSQNDNTDGAAGFRYVKLDADGQELAADATSWQCVKDSETNLIWEVKSTEQGARNSAYLFAYHLNRDITLSADEVAEASCDDDQGICTVKQYQEHINGLNEGKGLCGSTNWAVPSFNELYSLVHFGSSHNNDDDERIGIDIDYFPATFAGDYWTSSQSSEGMSYLYDAVQAWTLGFNDSYIGATTSYDVCTGTEEYCYPTALPVRLVTTGEDQ